MKRRRPYNPWAICTAAVGRKDRAKYERCVKKVKARIGMKNPSISAVWPTMKRTPREKVLMFAGIEELRAHYLAQFDWSDLPPDVKGALLKGWSMGTIGGTTRRRGGTTKRRVPVMTNPRSRRLTLKRWAAKQPYRIHQSGRSCSIPDGRLVDRSGAWNLSDYAVSSVAGGSIWFTPRKNGARRNGNTKGAYPFAQKEAQYRKYKMSELLYAQHDASETAKIWRGVDAQTENWYRDDVATITKEIRRREDLSGIRRAFKNGIPDWLRSSDRFYSKFGFTVERFENAIRGLSESDQQKLHRLIESDLGEHVVRWVMRQVKMKKRAAAKNRGKYRKWYVARAKHPIGASYYWIAVLSVDNLPPNVVGKVYVVGAPNKKQAILEVRDPESRWMKK